MRGQKAKPDPGLGNRRVSGVPPGGPSGVHVEQTAALALLARRRGLGDVFQATAAGLAAAALATAAAEAPVGAGLRLGLRLLERRAGRTRRRRSG